MKFINSYIGYELQYSINNNVLTKIMLETDLSFFVLHQQQDKKYYIYIYIHTYIHIYL